MILIGYFIGMLITVVLFSLINGALLRLAAKTALRKTPPFKLAFWISFAAGAAFFVIGKIAENFAKNGSVLTHATSSFSENMVTLIPLLILFLCIWLLVSNYFTNAADKIIGYANGFFVSLLNIMFLGVLGILLTVVMMIAFR